MNHNPGCAVAHSPHRRPAIDASSVLGLPRRRVVLDLRGGRWNLVAPVLLRAARSGMCVELARRPTEAEAIAAALRDGAHAYVVGSGDPEADWAFLEARCDTPPYAAVD